MIQEDDIGVGISGVEAMQITEMVHDDYTITSVLSTCANLGMFEIGSQIHAYLIRTEMEVVGQVANALISMYSKSGYVKLGDLQLAREIFISMKHRDVVAWTAIIVGYVQNSFNKGAMRLFSLMVREGPEPNNYTLAVILSVCSSSASLEHGGQIHSKSIRSKDGLSISVSNALITMYAKSGCIQLARRLFSRISSTREPCSWTTMIIAPAQHGLGEEAVNLLLQVN